ncbi:MAG: ABC transporter permease [Sporocytophaga sp.]|uniref:ABC transporter permease n=1 Tax=Sporocytophaga sp. TaxID=2231183 RepID=UPI001B2286F0|nr:FtsX-like permease family protein [Sporocytophaga sp.]MBO9700515.1 ABC transporter permease [Sporocytophaga sp.]
MNIYQFISSRIRHVRKDSFTYLVRNIAIASIAIGLAFIIVSFGILEGFKKRIKEKIFSFGAHIQVSRHDISRSYEESPFPKHTDLYDHPSKIGEIAHIQVYSKKAGLLKTEEEVNGVIVKGIGKDFSFSRFKNNIVEGRFLTLPDSGYSREIMISKRIANKMRLSIGDSVMIFFVQNPPRYRKLLIKGIYETGLEEFDDLIILGDIRLLQKINNWNEELVGGYEIFLKDFSTLTTASEKVFEAMDYDMQLEKITDRYIQIFDWLALLNRNVAIFLVLILFVASFNMVSTLFIMIMERTRMIGILKAFGATDGQIRGVFWYNGIFIILRGMLWGNIAGIGFCLLQYYFKIIPLDPENYYMSSVPIEWNFEVLALINVMTFTLIALVMFIPVFVISKIKPVKSIKFS